MKRVQFIGGELHYDVLDEGVEFDQVLERYTDCYKISVLGWVAKRRLEEATGDKPDAVDVLIELRK